MLKYYYMKHYKDIFYYFHKHQRAYGYRLTYYDSQHKRHEKSQRGFTTVNLAMSARDKFLRHQQLLADSSNMTVAELCKHVIDERQNYRKTTYKSYKHLLNDYVVPYIGNVKLVDLIPSIYREQCWNKLIKRGLSASTIKDMNARLQTAMNEAVDNKWMPSNPIRHPRMSKALENNERPDKVIMNRKQVTAFNKTLSRSSVTVQAIYLTLEHTGMRMGELLGLHWGAIDLTHHTIAIHYTRDEYGLRKPKTKTSNRKLTIDDELNNVLKQYYIYCRKHYHIDKHNYVILGEKGKPLIPNIVPHKLKSLLILSGLKNLIGKFTPHSFRHMFASKMIVDYHIDPLYVSRMLGHSNPSTTMKIYAQLSANKSLNIGKILNSKS